MNESTRNCNAYELTEEDWNDVTLATVSLAGKWRQLAVNLGLHPGTIDSIAGDFSKNRDCLNEAVLAWLHHKHNYRRKGLPTWRTLAKAVEPINCALAKKLLDRHLESGSSDTGHMDSPLMRRSLRSTIEDDTVIPEARTTTKFSCQSKDLVQHSNCSLHVCIKIFGCFSMCGLLLVCIGLIASGYLRFLPREDDVTTKFMQSRTANEPDIDNLHYEEVLDDQRIDLDSVEQGILQTTMNKYNIVIVEHHGLNERTGFWWLLFTFDYKLDKGIKIRLTNFKYSNCRDWTLEIVKCRYLGIDSQQQMESLDMADEFINQNELRQIVDCSRSSERLQKYLEENIIPLVIKKIKYKWYKPQFKLYLSYDSEDSRPFMRTFENGLQFLGYTTWLDETNMPIGSKRLAAIKTAIDDNNIFVAWLTPEYMERSISQAELRYAHSKRKMIFAFATSEVKSYFEGDFNFLNDLHVYDPYKSSFFEVLRLIDDLMFNFETFTF